MSAVGGITEPSTQYDMQKFFRGTAVVKGLACIGQSCLQAAHNDSTGHASFMRALQHQHVETQAFCLQTALLMQGSRGAVMRMHSMQALRINGRTMNASASCLRPSSLSLRP